MRWIVLVGYLRVSKSDGSQSTDLQRDALLPAGVGSKQLYEDQASGKKDDRPQLAACLKAVRATRCWCGNSTGSAETFATWSTPSTTSPSAVSA